MTRSTKRKALLVLLALVLPWLAVTVCDVVVSQRGGIYEVTHDWCVRGIGGRYGALEREATKQVDHSIQHVAYETEFFCGPLRLSFPFSAPVAISVLAAWVAAPVCVALLLRFGKHESRETQAA
jgi:hypothetical protein